MIWTCSATFSLFSHQRVLILWVQSASISNMDNTAKAQLPACSRPLHCEVRGLSQGGKESPCFWSSECLWGGFIPPVKVAFSRRFPFDGAMGWDGMGDRESERRNVERASEPSLEIASDNSESWRQRVCVHVRDCGYNFRFTRPPSLPPTSFFCRTTKVASEEVRKGAFFWWQRRRRRRRRRRRW